MIQRLQTFRSAPLRALAPQPSAVDTSPRVGGTVSLPPEVSLRVRPAAGLRGRSAVALVSLALLSGVRSAEAKTLLSFAAPQQAGQTAPPETTPTSPQAPAPKGKVLFERHAPPPADDAGTSADPPEDDPSITGATSRLATSRKDPHTLRRRGAAVDAVTDPATTGSGPAAGKPAPSEAVSSSADAPATDAPAIPSTVRLTAEDRQAASRISDDERGAVAVSAADLDLHLDAHTGQVEVRAQMTVHNAGTEPLQHLPLRISGALQWESGRLAGSTAPLPLEQHRLPDDLDHTGTANELGLSLGEPLAPGASVRLDLYYGGVLTASTQRLVNLGAPAGRAALTDWDTVSDTFTGLRGIGNVLWYPLAGIPASLRDGDAVTRAVETSRSRDAGESFRLRLTLAYAGSRPDAAIFCGDRKVLTPLSAESRTGEDGGVVTANWSRSALGRHTPSLFIADGAPQEVAGGLLRVVTDRADTAAAMGEAAARVRPMLAGWLGAAPDRPLDVLDLPIPGAAGFADGSLLVAPLTAGSAAALAPSLVQPLASAWLPDGIAAPWLRDGLPVFLQAVWAERTVGRDAALNGLASAAGALAAPVASPSPISSSSQPDDATLIAAIGPALATCSDPACSRGKAAYVFEMLRGMLGDSALEQAISGWRVQEEGAPRSATEETAAMERLLQQVAGTKDVGWFFRNWIDTDHGLPDLTIVTVAPRRVQRSAPVTYLPEAPKRIAGPIGAEPVPEVADPRHPTTTETASSSGEIAAPAAGSWLVAVEVQNNGGADAQVPVTVRNGSLTNTLPLRVPAHGRATIRVPFEAEPSEVLVNDGSVPETRTSLHRRTGPTLPVER